MFLWHIIALILRFFGHIYLSFNNYYSIIAHISVLFNVINSKPCCLITKVNNCFLVYLIKLIILFLLYANCNLNEKTNYINLL